ncbi:hypothetical protein QUF72_00730 [Desulfobacterales bacterium HSG2]|nr:hypothetical protein [Desulfobacterales bacterium HSG2]
MCQGRFGEVAIYTDEDLSCLTRLIDISREFEANQKTNLMISVIPGVICIGGVFLLRFGIYTSMLIYYLVSVEFLFFIDFHIFICYFPIICSGRL